MTLLLQRHLTALFGICLLGLGCNPNDRTETPATQTQATPMSNQEQLDLGDGPQMLDRLDSLVETGGTDAVVEWARRELSPGREVVYIGRKGPDQKEVVHLADRSIWPVENRKIVEGDPYLPPLTDEQYGDSDILGVWVRPDAPEPFALRIRAVRHQ